MVDVKYCHEGKKTNVKTNVKNQTQSVSSGHSYGETSQQSARGAAVMPPHPDVRQKLASQRFSATLFGHCRVFLGGSSSDG